MYEGKLPELGDARPVSGGANGDSLRALRWDELVARLAAARELRSALGRGETGADAGFEASFDASSASRIAAHHGGKQAVNLDALSNGKASRGTAVGGMQGGHPDASNGAVRN